MTTAMLLALALCGQGRTYYADGAPGHGSGTAVDPFHLDDFPAMVPGRPKPTPSFFDHLQPGDQVRLRGVIDLSAHVAHGANSLLGARPLINIPSGSPNAPIVITSDAGQVATLTANIGDQCLLGKVGGAGYVVLTNFRVVGGAQSDTESFSGGSSIVAIFGGFPDGTTHNPPLKGIVVDRMAIGYARPWTFPAARASNHQCLNIQGTVGTVVRSCELFNARWAQSSGTATMGHSSCLLGYWNVGTIVEDCYIHDGESGVYFKDAGRCGQATCMSVLRCLFDNNTSYHFQGYGQSERAVYHGQIMYGQVTIQDCAFLVDPVAGLPRTAAVGLGGFSDGDVVRNNLVLAKAHGGAAFAFIKVFRALANDLPIPDPKPQRFGRRSCYRTRVYNNVILAGLATSGRLIAYANPYDLNWKGQSVPATAPAGPDRTGVEAGSAWDLPFDYNAYDGPASYHFADGSFPTPQALWHDPIGAHFERNSGFAMTAPSLYEPATVTPHASTMTAGYGGGCLGPDPSHVLLGGPGGLIDTATATTRYGPRPE
jgi:hypothetical protein